MGGAFEGVGVVCVLVGVAIVSVIHLCSTRYEFLCKYESFSSYSVSRMKMCSFVLCIIMFMYIYMS